MDILHDSLSGGTMQFGHKKPSRKILRGWEAYWDEAALVNYINIFGLTQGIFSRLDILGRSQGTMATSVLADHFRPADLEEQIDTLINSAEAFFEFHSLGTYGVEVIQLEPEVVDSIGLKKTEAYRKVRVKDQRVIEFPDGENEYF